ncbi:methyltransferase, partial [Pseudomonas aeruginosa]|nr:methyltransferase [Pseudomonas aeruginosa]
MLIRSILPSAARGFEHAGAARWRR